MNSIELIYKLFYIKKIIYKIIKLNNELKSTRTVLPNSASNSIHVNSSKNIESNALMDIASFKYGKPEMINTLKINNPRFN